MKKIAVIDVGSNSVRLMFLADGKILYKLLNTTRLGEGIAFSPFLKSEAIERTAKAVAEYVEKAKAEGAEGVFAYATAAVRSAKNGAEFVRRVDELCGVKVEVLSGEEEAEIGLAGALGTRDGGVIDVGGASTEVIVRKNGKLVYEKSVDIGVVRLKDTCGRDKRALEQASLKAVDAYGNVPTACVDFYAIGGTATTLAALFLKLKAYDPQKITGTLLTQTDLKALADELLSLSVEKIAAHPCVSPKRADVIAGGAVLFSVLTQSLGIEKIIVSDSDNLEGYAVRRGLLN